MSRASARQFQKSSPIVYGPLAEKHLIMNAFARKWQNDENGYILRSDVAVSVRSRLTLLMTLTAMVNYLYSGVCG